MWLNLLDQIQEKWVCTYVDVLKCYLVGVLVGASDGDISIYTFGILPCM